MALEMTCFCDSCKERIDGDSDEIYCENCYKDLKKDKEFLIKEVEALEREIKRLKSN